MIWADIQKGLFFGAYTPDLIKAGNQDLEGDARERSFCPPDQQDVASQLDAIFAPVWEKLREPDEFELECGGAGSTPRPEELAVQKKPRLFKCSQHVRLSNRLSLANPSKPPRIGLVLPHSVTPRDRSATPCSSATNMDDDEVLSLFGTMNFGQRRMFSMAARDPYMASTAPAVMSAPSSSKGSHRASSSTPTSRRPRSISFDDVALEIPRPHTSCGLPRSPCEPTAAIEKSRPHTSCGDSAKSHYGPRIPPPRRPPSGGAGPPNVRCFRKDLMPCMEYGVRGSPAPAGCKKVPFPSVAIEAKLDTPNSIDRLTWPTSVRSGGTTLKSNQGELREFQRENVKENKRTLDFMIRRIVSGEDVDLSGFSEARLAVDKQSTYVTDNVQLNRDVTTNERASIYGVFRDIVVGISDEKALHSNKFMVPWSEVARRLRGRLSNANLQRLGVYLNFSKRVRQTGYLERVTCFMTNNFEERLRICFAILDTDGDAAIGPRDIFAALGSTKMGRKLCHKEHLETCFDQAGSIGLHFDETALEVVQVEAASRAEQAGVEVGDCVIQINGVDVEDMSNQAIRTQLASPSRPMRLHFFRGSGQVMEPAMLADADFEKILSALQEIERTSLRIIIVGAKGLRNADIGTGGKSDPYCLCEIVGKPHTKLFTKVVSDCLDPVWNEMRSISDYADNDVLRFTIYDRDVGSKQDESLGTGSLSRKMIMPNGFDGEINLTDTKKGFCGTLRVKASLTPGGGIGFTEFKAMFAHGEPSFFAPLAEMLTGLPMPKPTTASSMKLLVTMVSAEGLRNADPGGLSDPYCCCEILDKPQSRIQTRVIYNNLDPVWNEKREILNFEEGDVLRFTVYDKDIGANTKAESLGQAFLSCPQFFPDGFKGELRLTDAGKGHFPMLKVKIAVLGAPPPEIQLSPEEKAALAEANQIGRIRHQMEMRELNQRIWLSPSEVAWYLKTFHFLSGDDCRIHRDNLARNATKLFGVPCATFARRLYDVMDAMNPGTVGIGTWATMMEIISRGNCDQTMAFAFQLYDLDGDGIISINDGLSLIREEEELQQMLASTFQVGQSSNRVGRKLRDEMKWICNWIASCEGSDDLRGKKNLDVWWFHQVRPKPDIIDVLVENLKALGEGIGDNEMEQWRIQLS